MPFKSEAQRRFMWAKHPKIAKRWAHEHGFYTHMTHESLQPLEDSVEVIGDGFHDSSVPKTPKTDCFYAYKSF